MTTPNTQGDSWEIPFIEEAAAMEHERWAKWQAYLHSKCVEHEDGKGEWVCFPSDSFKRWERQINTPYEALSEKEKESDRAEVRQYLPLIRTLLAKERAEGERRGMAKAVHHVKSQYKWIGGVEKPEILTKIEEWLEEARTLPADSTEDSLKDPQG